MKKEEAETLAARIRSEVPDAVVEVVDERVSPEQYYIDVAQQYRFVIRTAGQWQERKNYLLRR